MNAYLQNLLSDDDITLFTQCACHVFANELACDLIPKGFVLSRLADLNRTHTQMRALHVFLCRDGVMVDVEGMQSVDNYIEESRQYRLQHGGPTPDFKVLDCARDDLFQPVPSPLDDERGPHNKWRHLIDPEFVTLCRRRARARLTASPELYGL
jgi:hypothetical protein